MPRLSTNLLNLLARGDYPGVIAAAAAPGFHHAALVSERGASDIKIEPLPWVVGALTFVGRTSEAEGLYSAYAKQVSEPAQVAGRFFLAVACCREGRYDQSRDLLLQNLATDRRLRRADCGHGLISFFAAQGVSFFRYATGRIQRAEHWAQLALRAASGAAFDYGRILSLEHLGHVQLTMGQVRVGMRSLTLARDLVETFGRGAVSQAIDASIGLYRAAYGLADAETIVRELQESVERCEFEDSYTEAALSIELARAQIMRGHLREAKLVLERASELVYQIDNPDLEIDHNVCLANLLRRQGESFQALSLIRGARHRARSRADLRLLLRVLGLEAQIHSATTSQEQRSEVTTELRRLTEKAGIAIGRRILARSLGEPSPDARPGDDPLGDLIDTATHGGTRAIEPILKSGWNSLLTVVLGVGPQERLLYFDAEPGSLTIFDRGDVRHVAQGCTDFIRKLISSLASGEASKETLAFNLWGRSYNPLRHDGLIYGLIAKSRRLLGEAGIWIEVCEVGYRLQTGVKVAARDLQALAVEDSPQHRATSDGERDGMHEPARISTVLKELDARTAAALNVRQASILRWLQAGEVVDARSTMERLKISDATASRDLTGLLELGLVMRMGRGRATRYALAEGPLTSQTLKGASYESNF